MDRHLNLTLELWSFYPEDPENEESEIIIDPIKIFNFRACTKDDFKGQEDQY